MFSSASRWLLLVAAAATLALGVSACGDSEDDADPPSAAQTADERTEPADSGADDAAAPGDRTDEAADAEPDAATPADQASPDSGDEPSGSGGSDAQASEEQAAAAVATQMYADLAAADARGVCAVMSKAVRQEIAQNVHGGSTEAPGERTCAKSFAVFLDAAATSGMLEQTLKARVGEAKVNGDSARVTVTIDGKSGEVELVKEDGQWRFGAAPTGPKS